MEKTDAGYRMGLQNSRRWHGAFLWDILGRSGKKVGVVNIPFFTPTELYGHMIDLHMESAYPPNILEEVSSQVESYRKFDRKIRSTRRSELNRLRENTGIEFDVGRYLLSYHPEIDLFIQVFNILDGTAHCTNNEETLKDRYIYMDNKLEKYLDESKNTFIVSDHGMAKVRRRFYLNRWLIDKGYLQLKDSGRARMTSLSSWLTYKIADLFPSLEFHLDDIGGILGRKIAPMRNLRNKGKEETVMYATDRVEWEETRAFAHASNASNYIGIWLNGEGVEAKEKLREALATLNEDGGGMKVLEEVYDRETLYHGPELKALPHLVLKLREGIMAHTAFSPVLQRSSDSYAHSLYGTFIARGPDIKKGVELLGAEIADVTPTILRAADMNPTEDMDGKVLEDIFLK